MKRKMKRREKEKNLEHSYQNEIVAIPLAEAINLDLLIKDSRPNTSQTDFWSRYKMEYIGSNTRLESL